jgi:hypothetical protein
MTLHVIVLVVTHTHMDTSDDMPIAFLFDYLDHSRSPRLSVAHAPHPIRHSLAVLRFASHKIEVLSSGCRIFVVSWSILAINLIIWIVFCKDSEFESVFCNFTKINTVSATSSIESNLTGNESSFL